MRAARLLLVAVALAGCGHSTATRDDSLIALETRREALAGLNQATAQLGAAVMTNRHVTGATAAYLRAVDTAVSVLPTRYVVSDRLVGIVANERRVAAWCEACAERLGRRADALRRSPRKFPRGAASQ